MAGRVVVAFRSRRVTARAPDEEHVERTRRLWRRAMARGARIVAWSASQLALDFPLDALEDAVDLLTDEDEPSGGIPEGFGVGIAEGELEPLIEPEGGSHVSLCWGPALVRATFLARIARAGEVLVDPALEAVRSGELLTKGARIGRMGAERLRGVRLDLEHPWRRALAGSVVRLGEAPLAGRDEALAAAQVSAGTLCILRANRGVGGTRFLRALGGALEPARVLMLDPHPPGEPLGALRRLLARERAAARGPTLLSGESADALEELLAGRGLSADAAAALLAEWLGHDGSTGVASLLIDDAAEVDRDTLEAVASAMTGDRAFRVVARLCPEDEIPEPLAGLDEAAEVWLPPLGRKDATALASGILRGAIGERDAARWAKRGAGLPLAVREALADSLEAAELLWDEAGARPRTRKSGRGRAVPARHWISRRFARLEPSSRAVLVSVAVLGGEAEEEDVAELVRKAANVPVDVPDTLAELEAVGWLERRAPDLVALLTMTHRDVLCGWLSSSELAEWHRAAARVLETDERTTVLPSAATHAALGGDLRGACRLALRAARAMRDVGLTATAAALERFAESEELAVLTARGLSGSIIPGRSIAPGHSVASSVVPPEGWSRVAPKRSSYPPVALPPELGADPLNPSLPRAPRAPRLPASGRSASEAAVLDADAREAAGATPAGEASGPPPGADPAAHASIEPSTGPVAAEVAEAAAALRQGDPEVMRIVAAKLHTEGRHPGLARRLEAMATLATGDAGEALRALRAAAENARALRSPERCRAALAHSVALAAAGRMNEALLEGLDGLARAREMHDERGERACIGFLAQLAQRAGRQEEAAGWLNVMPS